MEADEDKSHITPHSSSYMRTCSRIVEVYVSVRWLLSNNQNDKTYTITTIDS